ncbi:MAG: thiamine phosphate synthase [Ardenticatenia bacterium]|nr:thiamine phosphate synthase [Ardenticatenia bacterium]
MSRLPEPPLLVITARAFTRRPIRAVVAHVFAGGCRWLMVREKDLSDRALAGMVRDFLEMARPYQALVTVNGNVDVAADVGAHGVHLQHADHVTPARRRLGKRALIGVSAHSLSEAHEAARAGADYITLSPIFASISKPGYGPTGDEGLDLLRAVVRAIPTPVMALGGITAENAARCLEAGAAGVAVLGRVMGALNPQAEVRALVKAVTGGGGR